MMVGSHKKVFNIVLLNRLHSFNALSAAVLASEIIYIHTLDIA